MRLPGRRRGPPASSPASSTPSSSPRSSRWPARSSPSPRCASTGTRKRRWPRRRGSMATPSRLPAAERRASLLECACSVFSRGSYRGTTTAELAAEAGVTEPVLYRHFPSKRALYLACMDEGWARVRAMWDEVIAAEPDPARWVAAIGRAFLESAEYRPVVSHLWLQALAEGTGDPEIATY